MSSILVTGGRGFIGKHLVATLRARGHEVRTVDLRHEADPLHTRADVAEFRQLARVFSARRIEIVYHLAAEYGRWNGEDHYENLWRTNVVGTKHLLRLQEEHRFRLVFFSSAEVYGDYDGLMSEDVMERVPIRQMNDYAISKWAGELQCLNHQEMFGTETVRVRPVGCYGPGEAYSAFRGVIPIFVERALQGQPLTVHAGHIRVFDYVQDTCCTFANVVDRFRPGEVYNIGGREEWAVSVEELAEVVLEACDAPRSLLRIEAPEGHTTRIKRVDFSKARRDLGHDPQIDLREGVRRYVAWVRGEGVRVAAAQDEGAQA